MVEQGVSKVDIAKQVGVSVAGVCNVLKAD
nr:hypothetical protein [Leucothrix arctica]